MASHPPIGAQLPRAFEGLAALPPADLECYGLDKEVLQEVIRRRPDLAEHPADVLVQHANELLAAREGLGEASRQGPIAEHRGDVLGRIRSFFGLPECGGRAAG